MQQYRRKDFLKLSLFAGLAQLAWPFKLHAGNPSRQSGAAVTYFRKGSPEYEALRKGFNKRINKYPAVIALCHTAEGVAEAVKYAAELKLPVAVKSGGHCMEGFSCNTGGMVINLSQLSSISWVDDYTITVGPGCTLAQLYDVLLPKGKILPGGSCAGVAIGGLVLGGGYGLMARLFGLTCDSLLGLTMVDGQGRTVSTAGNPELLWACKGGGNGNFGVVTSLTFKVHKAPATMQSWRFKTRKVDAAKASALLEQWFTLTAALPPHCFSAFVLNGSTAYILLTATGKLTSDVQQVVQSLTAAAAKTTHSKPQPLARALKTYYGRPGPLFFKNASAGLYKDFGQVQGCIDKVLAVVLSSPGMIYQVNTLGGNIINPAFEAAASFPHRAYPYFSELQAYWEGEKQGERLMQRFQQVQDIFQAHGCTSQYRNYPDINFKDFETSYYGSNAARLKAVKQQYDPYNLIRHEQSIVAAPVQ